ncbi:hypothetical protein PHYSODRAFT_436643, partial [Phytophthora sojae]
VGPTSWRLNWSSLEKVCPVKELLIAGARWNTWPTHYYRVHAGILCHTVVPQYNVHAMYILENSTYNRTSASCSGQTIAFHGNFYHGSFGYYAIYAETQGAYCMQDGTAYLTVSGLGKYDINGLRLAQDRGDVEYRMSYWYIFTGTSFTLVRIPTLRRSFVSCRRFAKHCDQMAEPIRIQEAIV